MTRDVVFQYQHFVGVSEAQVTRLRSNPAELSTFLKRHAGQSLGQYWHAVPYLITGQATGVREPLRWFMDGGEILGRNEAGKIRYLSPARVARLAEALDSEWRSEKQASSDGGECGDHRTHGLVSGSSPSSARFVRPTPRSRAGASNASLGPVDCAVWRPTAGTAPVHRSRGEHRAQ